MRLHSWVLALSVLVSTAPDAQAQGLKAPRPEDVGQVASQAAAAVERLVGEVMKARESQRKLQVRSKMLADSAERVRRRRDQTLEEMRRGFFCSQCKRSKSEIERSGTNFYAHLRDVKGYPVPAPAELVAAKKSEYDRQIVQLERKRTEIEAEVQQLQARINEATSQIDEGLFVWRNAAGLRRN